MHQSTELEPFKFEGWSVRVEMIDGLPWFVAADVCEALDITNGRNAVSRLDEADVRQTDISSSGQRRSMSVINESGLYELIFRSDKPVAKRFRRWVTTEVLPSIRQTGTYGTAAAIDPPLLELLERAAANERERLALVSKVDEMAGALVLAHNSAHQALERIEEQQPKVDAFDTYLDAKGLKTVAIVAQEMGTGQNRLFAFLRRHRVLIATAGARWNTPYQERVDEGWFEVKAEAWQYKPGTPDEETRTTWTTLVTPKGEAGIRRLIVRHGQP